jgi:hypothetical protein
MKNSQKGTVLPIVIILALIVVIGGIYFIHNKNYNKPVSYNNSGLINTYPVLANENTWRSKLIKTDDPHKWIVSGKNITIQAIDYSGSFLCGNVKASFSKFSSYNTGTLGGWNNISIVSCDAYYFVFEYGDAGPKLFGPFAQNNTISANTTSHTDTNLNSTKKSSSPNITLLSPKIGETIKIGQSFLIQWNTNRILPPGYKFLINAGGGDQSLDAYHASTSYEYYYLVDKYRVTGDILNNVNPGKYKIKISLYDGVAPKDANGKTCIDRVKNGSQLFCSVADQYGKLITESISENYLTITN